MTQPGKSWLDENGRHVRLDHYLEIWEGWNDLISQLVEETGVSRDEAVALINLPSIRGLAESMENMYGGFEQMAQFFNKLAAAYSDMSDAYREQDAASERRNAIAERMMDLAEREIKESDGDAPWKDPG